MRRTLILLLLAACNRGAPATSNDPEGLGAGGGTGHERAVATRRASGAGVVPGIHPATAWDIGANPYTGNKDAIAAKQGLFVSMNCAGCHSGYAGGGMGPSLRDSLWIHGGSDAQVYASIAEGRANGMPAWGAMLPPDQIWRIVAYLRTLGTDAEPDPPPDATIFMRHKP